METQAEPTEQHVFSVWRDIERLRELPKIGNYRAQLADMRDSLDELVRGQNESNSRV